jgi:hypothetical protein
MGDVVIMDTQGKSEGENMGDVVMMETQGEGKEGVEEQTHVEAQQEGMVMQDARNDAPETADTDTDQKVNAFELVRNWFHLLMPFNKLLVTDDTEAE